MSRPPVRLRLELRPSRPLAAAIAGLHVAAGLCAAAVVPGAAGPALALALGALGFASAWSRGLLRTAGAVRALELDAQGLTLELAGGARRTAPASARRYVSRWLVAIPVKAMADGAWRRTILVTCDMLPAQDFRRLRIWALWGRWPGVVPEQLPA
ncbi:MAG TPA: protein YgfX [Burkholderiales bacterium]|nr:protein YgfX [Burkholderiales bacterium]